ncbi:hypothetical protein [Bdellovibrio sp.]|uniref:hypothetical protein n=1 Tax=Bdellovibrio sp. TaxID=28201 RepID=UPI003221AFE5
MEWDENHGWAKPLRTLVLPCGREIYLTDIQVHRTYAGVLEGTPHEHSNFLRLNRFMHVGDETDPKHQILPADVFKKAKKNSRVISLLPGIELTLTLESSEIIPENGAMSWMKVIYFCDDFPLDNFDEIMKQISLEVDWEKYAIDAWP